MCFTQKCPRPARARVALPGGFGTPAGRGRAGAGLAQTSARGGAGESRRGRCAVTSGARAELWLWWWWRRRRRPADSGSGSGSGSPEQGETAAVAAARGRAAPGASRPSLALGPSALLRPLRLTALAGSRQRAPGECGAVGGGVTDGHGEGKTGAGVHEGDAVLHSAVTGREGNSCDQPSGREKKTLRGSSGDEEMHRRFENAPDSAKTKALQTVIEMKDSKISSMERGLRDLEEEIQMLKSNGALSTEEREEEMRQMEVYRSHSKFMKNKVMIGQVKQELSRKDTELLALQTKLETLTNQFSDSKQHTEVLKESLTAKEPRGLPSCRTR
ncbi:uncharacterized protein LOC130706696 [Balaenoptera acutorostrata]|uniref:Uncharacterized protein LOC130706696 n=1 Tax=Balaenoptera acutorostrata TaxID=9767 RepID=A0ABM3SZV1_BALAC|nr:uncharacterized protein LOC130706696 [Balaenoptera acutorostrata]